MIIVFILFAAGAYGAECGINFHGISYHPDRQDSQGNDLQAFNPGVGLNITFHPARRHQVLADGGGFRNSIGDIAEYASLGYRYRIVSKFYLGAALVLLRSSAVNQGDWLFAPLPVAAYRFRQWSFQMLYAPRFRDRNQNAVFAFYATWYFY